MKQYRKKLPYRYKKGTLDNILDRIKKRDKFNQPYPLSFFEEKKKETTSFIEKINKRGYMGIVDIFVMCDIHADLFCRKRETTTGEQEIIIMWNELKLFNNQYDKVKNLFSVNTIT